MCSALPHISAICRKGEHQHRQFACRRLQSYQAILLAFFPDPCLTDIECMGIGNVIRRHGSPLGDIASIHVVIDHIHAVLAIKCKKDSVRRRAYMMLIGNYGRHMAFATDPPYCVAYTTDYKNTTILPK